MWVVIRVPQFSAYNLPLTLLPPKPLKIITTPQFVASTPYQP